ncbi:MAG: ABC transporter permease [Acidimicrobiales bacterium]|nr:ABC transporter permease [Acidimicrobiales bacterium]
MSEISLAPTPPALPTEIPVRGRAALTRRQRRRRPSVLIIIAAVWIGAWAILAVIANWIPLANPSHHVGHSRVGPFHSWSHPLGTDALGRDELSRLIFGARQSLAVSVIAAAIAMSVGAIVGLLSAYIRNFMDVAVGTFTDAILAFPPLVFLLAVAATIGPSSTTVTGGLAIVSMPAFIRLSRANALRFVNREFVQANRLMGAGPLRIVFKEILPNILAPIAAYAVVLMAFLIVAASSLSYLGLGVPPPAPSWGAMIADGQPDLVQHPGLVFVPAVVLFITVYALNVLGDAARQRFDVRESAL